MITVLMITVLIVPVPDRSNRSSRVDVPTLPYGCLPWALFARYCAERTPPADRADRPGQHKEQQWTTTASRTSLAPSRGRPGAPPARRRRPDRAGPPGTPLAKDQTTEALNFGISLCVAQIVCLIVSTLLAFTIIIPILMGFIQFVIWVVGIVLGIMAGLKARDGVPYRYPVNIRLVT